MILLLVSILLGLAQVEADKPVLDIPADTEWCAILNTLPPGTEGVLQAGTYTGPCTIRASGTATAPLVIRGSDLKDRPRIVYGGRDDNALNIRADHVIIRGLHFERTRPDVDAVRVRSGSDITIEDCRFEEIGGIAIVANHSSSVRIVVRRNEIIQSRATAMYFGCHDGAHCAVSDLLVERNYVRGVDAAPSEIGYGIQIKLNSAATIRDNVIVDTKGPGIMVYGATDLSKMSVVERNFVTGSRTSSAIVVGGGPAMVRNNIVTSSTEAGIGLEDYHRRGLLRGVVIAHNTGYGSLKGGITVPDQVALDVKIVNNAFQALAGAPPFPTARPGVFNVGNVDCSILPCFVDPKQLDFSPLAVRRGSLAAEPWIPPDDYFGRRRSIPPVAGAIDTPARAISLGIKPPRQ